MNKIGIEKSDIKKTLIFTVAVFIMTLSGALLPLSDGAYIHIGDAAVYMAALMLPAPLACIAAAVGAGAADVLLGSGIYLVPTLIIKPLTVIVCQMLSRLSKDKSTSDLLACGAGVVTVIGYLAAEMLIGIASGKENAVMESLDSIMFNCVQALAAAVVFLLLANTVRRIYGALKKRAEKKQEEQNESTDL